MLKWEGILVRLSNVKTRSETGLDYVLNNINIITPFGRKIVKDITPFFPGAEKSLRYELDKLEQIVALVKDYPGKIELLLEAFMEIKDNSFTIGRTTNNVLTVVELFEIKSYLLQLKKLSELLADVSHIIPREFVLYDTTNLLDIMDPGKERINTFYIYDEFSEKLSKLRKEKRELELKVRQEQKVIKQQLEKKYGFSMTPKFELVVSKANTELLNKAKGIEELRLDDEDYMSSTFVLKSNDAIYSIKKKMEELNDSIEEEELVIREQLSKKISINSDTLTKNSEKIGELDFVLAKAIYAIDHACVKPEIINEHRIQIEEGRHLVVEDILIGKKKDFCPISIQLANGVTCITGANMGGKTVSLKLLGMVAILTQYGFYVPCKSAEIGLSRYIHILIGDSQSMQRGLSSFGSEMEELKEILDNSKEGSLLLIDEIASGTNPIEGLALTKSLIGYLNKKDYISLITTHFDNVTEDHDVKNMQVRGLANADFNKLGKELRYANRKERIELISKYMDYRLYHVEKDTEIPKEALNIAKMLGIYDEIIEGAKRFLEH